MYGKAIAELKRQRKGLQAKYDGEMGRLDLRIEALERRLGFLVMSRNRKRSQYGNCRRLSVLMNYPGIPAKVKPKLKWQALIDTARAAAFKRAPWP